MTATALIRRAHPLAMVALALAALATGCRKDPAQPPAPESPAANPRPAQEVPAASPEPTAPPRSTEPTIAVVFGHVITESEVRAALAAAPPGTTVRDGVVLAIGRHLASLEARRLGFPRSDGESEAQWVERFLAATFGPSTSCRAVSDADVADAYRTHKRHYVHPDVFRVLDLQLVCCPKQQVPCVGDEEAARCFTDGAGTMEAARQSLGAVESAEAFRAAGDALRSTAPTLALMEYSFAYAYDRPHRDQRGPWAIMDPSILEAVRGAEAGTVTEPIRSPFGYHVMFVVEHRPPEDKGPDDPSVQRELRDRLCDAVLRRTRSGYLRDLVKGSDARVVDTALEALEARVKEEEPATGDSAATSPLP